LRALADYSGDPVDIEKAGWAIERAAAFVAAVKELISRRHWGGLAHRSGPQCVPLLSKPVAAR
jgi:hypothetical protein